MDINWSEKNMTELQLFFSTDIKKGLTNEQYISSKEKYGENIIDSDLLERQNFYGLKKKKRNINAMLSGSAGIAGILYFFTVILLKIIGFDLNIYLLLFFYIFIAAASFILGFTAEKKYERLYKSARPKAIVIRGGKRKKVYIESIVPGDLILISAGDIVPADARIVSDVYLSCIHINDDGQSVIMTKTSEIAANTRNPICANIVYAADVIESGTASAIVIATGKNALIKNKTGKIDKFSNKSKNPDLRGDSSGMQKYIRKLSRDLFLTSVFLSMLMIFAGIMQNRDFLTLIMTCLTVLIASFSEQLPIIADFAVLNGMDALSKLGILIKKPSVIDEINDIDTVIAKKNESFTQDNKMVLEKISGREVSVENISEIGYILNYMAMCSNVDISYAGEKQNQNTPIYTGSAIDVAVFEALNKCQPDYDAVNQPNQKIGKTIYNPKSGIKSAVILESGKRAKFKLICFGEAGNILERCIKANGLTIDSGNLNFYMNTVQDLYKENDLIMAVAARDFNYKEAIEKTEPDIENNLEFLGFACFSEPKISAARKISKLSKLSKTSTVLENINCLKKSGINPVMITDSDTVYSRSAAVKFGIVKSQDNANIIDDNKINQMGDNMFFMNADKFNLFTPVSLENRIKFLKALKLKNKSPAITVNDIEEKSLFNEPCVTFTSVNTETGILKNKASVITKNLTVSAILETVKNSVLIYRNILKIAYFASALCISQYLLILLAVLFNGAYILNPVQILWAGTGAGFIFAVSICFNEENNGWQYFRKNIRNYKATKKLHKHVLKRRLIYGLIIFFIAAVSFFVCIGIKEFGIPVSIRDKPNFIGVFKFYISSHSAYNKIEIIKSAQTAAFISYLIACASLAFSYIRGSRFKISLRSNKIFTIAFAANFILLLCAVFIPAVRDFLGFGEISAQIFGISIFLGLSPWIIIKLINI